MDVIWAAYTMSNAIENVTDTVLERNCNDTKYEVHPMSKSIVNPWSETMSKIKDVSADLPVVKKTNIKAQFKIRVSK